MLGKSRLETEDPLDDGRMRPTASPWAKMFDKEVNKTTQSMNRDAESPLCEEDKSFKELS